MNKSTTTVRTRRVIFKSDTGDTDNGSPKSGKSSLPAAVRKIKAVREAITQRVVGREAVVDATLLALVAAQNPLFIGPPGTAKTLVADLLGQALGVEVFSTMLTKFSKPSEILGPIDMAALERSEMHYVTTGFLPTATVAVLDEVFKGSSAICNALLTITNERRFKNGPKWERCKTRMVVGMSNEFPEDPAMLAAFFDRFPVKMMVRYLEADDFTTMLTTATTRRRIKEPLLDEADLKELDALVTACEFPKEVADSITSLRSKLIAKSIMVSDRRYVQAVRLCKAAAVMAGRSKVTNSDLRVLEFVLWNTEADLTTLRSLLPDVLAPTEKAIREIMDECYEVRAAILTALNAPDTGINLDTNRSSPDPAAAITAASKGMGRLSGLESRLAIVAEEVNDDPLAENMMESAKSSLAKVRDGIKAITKGDTGGKVLAASEDDDII